METLPPLETTENDPSAELTNPGLEVHISRLGESLAGRLSKVIAAVPGAPTGPVKFAKAIGVDKVLASRVLRAAAERDPIAALRAMPGPEPLRRLSQAARRRGVDPNLIRDLELSVAEFDQLIRTELGDRSALDAILTSWLPESRGDFAISRKQAAYRAISQLRGSSADVMVNTVFVAPTPNDPDHIDLIWLIGMLGLQRVRPGAPIKLGSRRIVPQKPDSTPRTLVALDGAPAADFAGLRMPEFCSKPLPPVMVQPAGEVMHYLVGDAVGFGPGAAIDLVFGELNRRELNRHPAAPTAQNRGKIFVFAEVNTPCKHLLFDVFIHRDLAPKSVDLAIYDTAFDGSASPNNPARDLDRMDLGESVTPLGTGIRRTRAAGVPWYEDLLDSACQKLPLNPEHFTGFRTAIDYPLYGTQAVLSWEAV